MWLLGTVILVILFVIYAVYLIAFIAVWNGKILGVYILLGLFCLGALGALLGKPSRESLGVHRECRSALVVGRPARKPSSRHRRRRRSIPTPPAATTAQSRRAVRPDLRRQPLPQAEAQGRPDRHYQGPARRKRLGLRSIVDSARSKALGGQINQAFSLLDTAIVQGFKDVELMRNDMALGKLRDANPKLFERLLDKAAREHPLASL